MGDYNSCFTLKKLLLILERILLYFNKCPICPIVSGHLNFGQLEGGIISQLEYTNFSVLVY